MVRIRTGHAPDDWYEPGPGSPDVMHIAMTGMLVARVPTIAQGPRRPPAEICRHGHHLTNDTVYVVPSTGARMCRICKNLTTARSNARRAVMRRLRRIA